MEALESFWSAMILPTGNASISATSSLIFPSATLAAEKSNEIIIQLQLVSWNWTKMTIFCNGIGVLTLITVVISEKVETELQ